MGTCIARYGRPDSSNMTVARWVALVGLTYMSIMVCVSFAAPDQKGSIWVAGPKQETDHDSRTRAIAGEAGPGGPVRNGDAGGAAVHQGDTGFPEAGSQALYRGERQVPVAGGLGDA